MEELENQIYWTTDEIKNCKMHFVCDEWIPKSRYDELQKELETLRDEYCLAEKEFYNFKSAVKTILKHYH